MGIIINAALTKPSYRTVGDYEEKSNIELRSESIATYDACKSYSGFSTDDLFRRSVDRCTMSEDYLTHTLEATSSACISGLVHTSRLTDERYLKGTSISSLRKELFTICVSTSTMFDKNTIIGSMISELPCTFKLLSDIRCNKKIVDTDYGSDDVDEEYEEHDDECDA